MGSDNLSVLPLLVRSFSCLRARQQIYVDKTQLIYKLASRNGRFLFTRPWGFGKTLLISTFESLFKNGLEEFEGLEIEKLWKEEREYNVVRIEFLQINAYGSVETFKEGLAQALIDSFKPIGFKCQESEGTVYAQLSEWIKTQPPASLVLLINDYDAPFINCLFDGELRKKLGDELSKFYALLQENDEALRFLFITGITNFCKHQLFSDPNYVTDISLEPDYGSLVGFTLEELTTYFNRLLDLSCEVLSISNEELLRKLAHHYLGYCFERTASQKVFSPWDILCFLTVPEHGFKPYWFQSGSDPQEIIRCFPHSVFNDPVNFVDPKTIPFFKLSDSKNLGELTDLGLLTQTGFLSIRDVAEKDFNLDFSTAAVRTQMARLYTKMLFGSTGGK